MISIGIIEDLPDYRNLLAILIANTQDLSVSFACATAEEAIPLFNEYKPEIAIIDIHLPGLNGIELVKWLKYAHSTILCMICTAYDEDEKVFQSLEAGAHGYLLKSTSPGGIIEAIIELHNGGSPMSSQVARKVVTAFRKPAHPAITLLTEREKEVLSLLSKGLLYKEIASSLTISIETVKRHCFNIYKKLHVTNRTEAIGKFFGR